MNRRNIPMLFITLLVVIAAYMTMGNVFESWRIQEQHNVASGILPDGPTMNAETNEVEYRDMPVIGSRVFVWVLAQLHLMFGAFVLAVPMFALIIEFIGYFTGDKKYDKLAYEFTKLLSTSFSFTATLGAVLTFALFILYPKVMDYMIGVFSWTFLPYALLFFAEAGFLYAYYYGWGKFSPKLHLGLGIGLNLVGTAIMFIANAWLTFMNSPAGVTETGQVFSMYEAFTNYTWMPINIHRLIANVAFGGSIAAAYGAFKFLGAQTDEERAHYDWMGYTGNFIAIMAFLPLPFAGYWLGKEIYAYDQSLGLVLMGGTFSWLFIIQAVLIGNLFLAANLYLWIGMERIDGAERYRKFIGFLLFSILICFMIWATPHSMVASAEEAKAMGGSHHPILGVLGVMSAKNTAVNILILTTFISFLLYRRAGKGDPLPFKDHGGGAAIVLYVVGAIGFILTISPAYAIILLGDYSIDFSRVVRVGLTLVHCGLLIFGVVLATKNKAKLGQFLIFTSSVVIVIIFGVYGYFVEASTRIGFSVYQVINVLSTMLVVGAIDVYVVKGAPNIGKIRWGTIHPIGQYALFFLAITFTWLMGLMGYVRAGLRQHWHVYGVLEDTSVNAFTPTLGFAATVVSITVIIFFTFIAIVFWLSGLTTKKDWSEEDSSDAALAEEAGS